MKKPRIFLVVSAPYLVGLFDPYNPPEEQCDVAVVFCRTKRRAKILAVRFWRHENRRTKSWKKRYESVNYYADQNPFTGMKVEDVTDEYFLCEHGKHYKKCDCYNEGSFNRQDNGL